jgi:hypothetical protein
VCKTPDQAEVTEASELSSGSTFFGHADATVELPIVLSSRHSTIIISNTVTAEEKVKE